MSEERKIKNITEYLEKVSEIKEGWSNPVLAFRGQENAEWPLASSAERRLQASSADQDGVTTRLFIEYHENLLTRCKLKNYDKQDGKQLYELELLADLQHHGAATCLLDFTRNALVALWFACEKLGTDGKVFVVNTDDGETFLEITPKDIQNNSIGDILEFKARVTNNDQAAGGPGLGTFGTSQNKPNVWYWPPAHLNERITAQHSLFLFGLPSSGELGSKEIVIESASKEKIRRELKELYDIHEESLFPDFVGFAYTQRHNAPYDVLSATEYLRRGAEALRQGQYSKAVECYDRCIQLEPDVREPYFLRGNAKATKQDYAGAKQDYNLAVDRSDRPYLNWTPNTIGVNDFGLCQILFNRANAKAELHDYEGALEDYGTAIEHSPHTTMSEPIFFNRANVKSILLRFKDAIEDYDEDIRLGSRNAYFNKGNVLVKLGRFDEACQCYDKWSQEREQKIGPVGNGDAVKRILERIDGRKFETTIDNSSGLVQVQIVGCPQEKKIFPFQGNIGNTGNFGGNGLPGGKGYHGQSGFAVQLVRRKG